MTAPAGVDTLGRHLIAEFYGCGAAVLDDEEGLRAAIVAAAEGIGATVLGLMSHRYAPQGVTATALIAESHLSIHTWPEYGYAAVDIFTCGGLDPRPGFAQLAQALGAERTRVQEIVRGLPEHVGRAPMPEDVVIFSSIATDG
jgi:S-adenosylmethionine decarboxylase